MPGPDPIDQRLLGRIEQLDIPRKTLCAESGVCESALSKIYHGKQDFQKEQVWKLAFAAGKLTALQQTNKETV